MPFSETEVPGTTVVRQGALWPPDEHSAGAGERPKVPIENAELATVLDRVADLLEVQDANPYRVRAYRNAASAIRASTGCVADLARAQGRPGLERLPTIGPSIAAAIYEYVSTGRLGLLDRLEGQVAPEDLFATLPGIGEELARRIYASLDVETLEELELAAHNGRLERIPGFGHRRAQALRDILASMLGRSARVRARLVRGVGTETLQPASRPDVGLLLAMDAEYRRAVAAGELRKIAPRRFNPEGRAWLPVLHTEAGGWSLSLLYSNTARAHELGRTHDWVVVYYEHDGDEGQSTIVTERHGSLAGRRVVRGREAECQRYYAITAGRDADRAPRDAA